MKKKSMEYARMSGTRGPSRCEVQVRRVVARMTCRLPHLSDTRPNRNIPSPYPAEPAAYTGGGGRSIYKCDYHETNYYLSSHT